MDPRALVSAKTRWSRVNADHMARHVCDASDLGGDFRDRWPDSRVGTAPRCGSLGYTCDDRSRAGGCSFRGRLGMPGQRRNELTVI